MIKLIFSIVLFSLNIYSSQIIYTSEFIDVERKIADIIAVSGDPLKDMNNMKDVIFVMKEGKVFVDRRNE